MTSVAKRRVTEVASRLGLLAPLQTRRVSAADIRRLSNDLVRITTRYAPTDPGFAVKRSTLRAATVANQDRLSHEHRVQLSSSTSSLSVPHSRLATRRRHGHDIFRVAARQISSTALTKLPAPTPTQPADAKEPKPLTQPLKTLQSLTPHENIYTIPNILTFTRLISAPVVGYLILNPEIPHIYALCLFAYSGFTDLLDGYLARRFNQFTVVGSVIDPMADKLLMTICTFSLAYTSILPLYTAVVIIGRDVALAISAIWWRWISLPPPKTMTRYWDFSLPSAEVHPTEISKINTLLQLLLIGNAMVLPVLPEAIVGAWNLWGVFEGWCGLVSATTIWSGLSYIGNKDAVKIIGRDK